jgi:glucosamine--fructose-6-phosphate aminotransferase (isomerizing)
MCGIIGYIGKENASPIILEGLKSLEYRGYDSAGVALITPEGLVIKKDKGRVEEVHRKLNFLEYETNLAIAHTRWATHGEVSEENAHPHTDCESKVAIVHNGIIENYQELKKSLISCGHIFKGESDSEVISHLIEEELKKGKNFEEACCVAFSRLEGTFAILAIKKGERKIIGVRKGSPLVLGISSHGYFVASDILSFLKHTRKVVYLYDYDLVVLDSEAKIFNIRDGKLEKVERPVHKIDWDFEKAEKGEFKHFMLKEICEQVETVQRAVNQKKEDLERVVEEIKKAGAIFFVGCGSSYHACLAAKYLFSKIGEKYVNVLLASEFLSYVHLLTQNTLVIAVSQSGETYDVLEAVRSAKKMGSKVISIVNVVGSSLARESDFFLPMNAGPEICVVSTKTYTSQLALLTLLAYALKGKFEEGKDKLKSLQELIYNLTSMNTRNKIKELAEKLKSKEHVFCIGRGLQYVTALEAALKIKEVSYVHAEAFAGGELKHGTIALIENGVPCIVFVSEENEKEIISNAVEIKSRGGYIIGISPKNNEIFDFWIKVPEAGNENSIVQIIPIQILAYQLALLRGCDPDYPRNLAKSVVVK